MFGGQSQPSSLFGGGQATGGLFGAQPAAQPTGGLFGGGGLGGATPTMATSSIFGSAAPSGATGGLFGGTTTASTLFGSTAGISGMTSQTGGLFGTGAPSQPSTGGLFGGAPSQPSGGLFGAAQPTGGLGFGTTPSLGGGMSFGATSQPFGQKPLFGATSTAPATGGLFGTTNPGATGSLFGSSSQMTGGTFASFADAGGFQESPGTQQDEFKAERVKDNFHAQAYNMASKYQPFSLKLLRLKDYNDFKQGKVHPKIMNDLQTYVAVCKGQMAGSDQKAASPFGATTTFGGTGTGGLFGQSAQPAATGGLFGAIGSQPAQTGGLFGGGGLGASTTGMGASAPAGGLFGASTAQPTGGLFGAPAAQPTGGLFGATSPQPAAGGLFGQPAQPAQPTGGLFGGAQPAMGGGLFGQTATPQPQTGGLFGGAGGGGMMGGQPAAGGLFGGAATGQTTGGLFGGTSAAPTGGLFGGQPSGTGGGGGLFGGQAAQMSGMSQGGLFPANQGDPNAALNALASVLQMAAKSMAANPTNPADQRSNTNRRDDDDPELTDHQRRSRKYSQDKRHPPSEETEIDQLRREHLAQIQNQQRISHFSNSIGSNPLNYLNSTPTLFDHRTRQLTKPKQRPVIDAMRNESSKNASLFGTSTASSIRDARSVTRLDESAFSLSRYQSTDAGTSSKIRIEIEIENGSVLLLSVSPSDVVSEVIRKLIDELGHPQNSKEAQDYGTNWELTYEGKKLSPISRLQECSILPLKENLRFTFQKRPSITSTQPKAYELAPTEAVPILTKEGYSTNPEYSRICRMSEQELREVSNFEIRHKFATIAFIGKTDLRGVNIDEAIRIQHRVVEIYPDDVQKPPKGQGLNKPAQITLKQFGLKQKNNNDKYISTLKAKLAAMNSVLIGADFAEDSIKFQVEGTD